MDLLAMLIPIISGIVGGNIAGAALPDKSLGAIGNSITGFLGGAAGGYIMQALGLLTTAAVAGQGAVPAEGFDFTHILEAVGGGGAGGALLTVIAGFVKNALGK